MHKDFDAFFAEVRQVGPTLTLFGETHQLPASVTVDFVLRWQTTMVDRPADKVVSDREIAALFTAMLGKPLAEKLIRKGLTVLQMVDVLGWAMQAYGVTAAPKATAPAPAATAATTA